MDQREQDSGSALAVNKVPPNYPCVTESTETTDRQQKRPSESSSPSDDLRCDSGSLETHKKSAIEHDETATQVMASSSLASSTGESLVRQSREFVTTTVTGGQVGQCVRTVAETSPMPDLFTQDEDGDT